MDETLPPPPPPPTITPPIVPGPVSGPPTQAYWAGPSPEDELPPAPGTYDPPPVSGTQYLPSPDEAIPHYFEPSSLVPGMQAVPPLPPRPKHKRRRTPSWFFPILAVAGALLVGIGIGAAGRTTTVKPVAGPTVTQTQVVTHAVTQTAQARPAPTVTVTHVHTHTVYVTPTANAQHQATVISSDGVYVTGKDIASGTWHTSGDGGQTGSQCYEATLSGPDSNSDIISNNNFDGPDTVDVTGAYAFMISGPCTWSLQG